MGQEHAQIRSQAPISLRPFISDVIQWGKPMDQINRLSAILLE
jgi:hypothetical protein